MQVYLTYCMEKWHAGSCIQVTLVLHGLSIEVAKLSGVPVICYMHGIYNMTP